MASSPSSVVEDMSFPLVCPTCGLRESEEFRYGGELRPRPDDPSDPALWADYVYNRANLPGWQREWWCHHLGCQEWFVAERETTTNEVRATYRYAAAAAGSGEA